MDDRDRVPRQGKRGPNRVELKRVGADRDVARLPPRRRPMGGQMRREPLLQLTRSRRGDQGRSRGPTADVDQEPRPVGV